MMRREQGNARVSSLALDLRSSALAHEGPYDEFGRLSATNVTQGSGTSFAYIYDCWGNRWQQNAAGSSESFQFRDWRNSEYLDDQWDRKPWYGFA